MSFIRRTRGIALTAVVWAIPWAVLGGIVPFAIVYSRPGLPMSMSLAVALYTAGAKIFGVLGAASGATFATVVAVLERRTTFASLSASRVSVWGGLGALAVASAIALATAVTRGGVPSVLLPYAGFATALGAVSAWTMLRLARASSAKRAPEELVSGDRWPDAVARAGDKASRPTT
jgi:hypothetical protein